MTLKAPFPWFGGKSRAASLVWQAFGADVANYVEPFFGSGAVLLARPGGAGKVETVNDLDCFLANFWRAVQADPDAVAKWADWPVSEGICAWIGSGWCSGRGVNRQLPHLGDAGMGVHRATAAELAGAVRDWMQALADRMRRVRVACGDWSRVLGDSVTVRLGTTAVFLDPPYDDGAVDYAAGSRVSSDVRAWAVEHGDDPRMRIALCGYEGEHAMPDSWRCVPWKARGGYGSQRRDGSNRNAARERIWLSPHCLPVETPGALPLEAT